MTLPWRFRWRVTLYWESANDSPAGWGKESVHHLDNVFQLRDLIMRARRDPRIADYRYVRYVERDWSKSPTSCPGCGTSYQGGSANRPRGGWLPCDCGGHQADECRVCGHRSVYPAVAPGCEPTPVPAPRKQQEAPRKSQETPRKSR
ncbi:MAG TPA: hypothetical protein VFE14_01940 [Micromonosporaceae bacterium]|nr:hypothetical protein [Micromonosporaceae bacterium]